MIFLLLIIQLVLVSSSELKLWSIKSPESISRQQRLLLETKYEQIANPRLRSLENKYLVEDNLSATLGRLKQELSKGSEATSVKFDLPDSKHNIFETTCTLVSGVSSVSVGLAAKFPSMGFMKGLCHESGKESPRYVEFVFDEDRPESFSATFALPGTSHPIYVDHTGTMGSSSYVIYRGSEIRGEESLTTPPRYTDAFNPPEWVVTSSISNETKTTNLRASRDLQGTFTARKMKMGLLTSRGFSDFHGGTAAGAVAACATIVARLNNLWLREFGIFFELIPENDQIICLSSETDQSRIDVCNSVTEDPGQVLFDVPDYMAGLGVSSDTFDLGHVLNTGGGGVAYVSVLCATDGWNARGATGVGEAPWTDGYALEIFSHEAGHMMDLDHTFRDCYDTAEGISNRHATESGSGATIMAYTGLCGNRDSTKVVDHHYTGPGLVSAMNKIEATNCGEITEVPDVRSYDLAVASSGTCKVPIGSSFGLGARNTNPSLLYSWERTDAGYENFLDTSLGHANTWEPMDFSSRYFPNLLTQIYSSASPIDTLELLPTIPRTWTWTLIERSEWTNLALNSDLTNMNLAFVGQFHQVSTTVEFVQATQVSIQRIGSTNISPGSRHEITFIMDPALALYADIMIAENVYSSRSGTPVSEDLNHDFNWVRVARVSMIDGITEYTGTVAFPGLSSSSASNSVIMVRGSSVSTDVADENLCYFFDIVSGITLQAGSTSSGFDAFNNWQSDLVDPNAGQDDPTPNPTPAPTPNPTPAPTPNPTPAPTPNPTPAPTPNPTPAPTPNPTPATTPMATPIPTTTISPPPTSIPTPDENNDPDGTDTNEGDGARTTDSETGSNIFNFENLLDTEYVIFGVAGALVLLLLLPGILIIRRRRKRNSSDKTQEAIAKRKPSL